MDAERTTYYGRPAIKIPVDDGPDSYMILGYKRAKAIVDNIDEIENFCIDCES